MKSGAARMLIRRVKSESEFESIYHQDDDMQNSEVSFFENYEYEGDDYQVEDLDNIIQEAFTKRDKQINQLHLRKSQLHKKSGFDLNTYDTETESTTRPNTEIEEIFSSHALDFNQPDQQKETIIYQSQQGICLNLSNQHEYVREDIKTLNENFLKMLKEKKKDKIRKMLNSLVSKGVFDVNCKNDQGMDSVLMCCATGHLEILKILTNDLNANISVINQKDRRVGLHYACINNHPQILTFLLQKNPSLKNFQDYNDSTPLFYASLYNHEKCVDIILSYDANVSLLNSSNLLAVEVTSSVVIQKLLERKNLSQAQNEYKRTQISSSNKLSLNSRKDRVSSIIRKVKFVHEIKQMSHLDEKDNCPSIFDEVKYVRQTQNGTFINRMQSARLKSMRNQMKNYQQQVKQIIHKQIESEKRCAMYMEKLQKMNQPIRVKRKVKLEDFIAFRQIGEGAFGEVYLVKVKDGLIENVKENQNKYDRPPSPQSPQSPLKQNNQDRKMINNQHSNYHLALQNSEQINQQNLQDNKNLEVQHTQQAHTKGETLINEFEQKNDAIISNENQREEKDELKEQFNLIVQQDKDQLSKEQGQGDKIMQNNQNIEAENTVINKEDQEEGQQKENEEQEQEERKLAERLKKLRVRKNEEEEDNPSQKFYALKIIRKEALKKKKIAGYIFSEKNIMQEINHPFIAKLHLTFQDDFHLFFLMDFYSGGDLGRVLEKEMELEERQVKIWAAQLVLALEELHNKDIVYRDLKPENVVLDSKGNIHLIDFGLAKKGANEISRSFCGTPIYLPPEIIGKGGYNKMVDWYSLGVIIYELLVGRPPYFSKDCKQLFNDIQTQPLRIPKQLPEDSKNLLISLLRKNYKQRLGYKGDAMEIKKHPWFAELDWERVYSKQYTCIKPMVLSIPSNPIDLHLQQGDKKDIVEMRQTWSFCLLSNNLSDDQQIDNHNEQHQQE